MKSRIKILFYLGASFLILLLGQNCAKVGGGTSLSSQSIAPDAEEPSKDLSLDAEDVPVNPPGQNSLKKTCADLDATVVNRQVTIDFPSPAIGCQYNVNGNGPALNRTWGATTTQMDMFQLTDAEEICSASMSSPANPNFTFNDNLVISLNNHILLTSHDFQAAFLKAGIFEIFDWTKLVATVWEPQAEYSDCPGKAEGASTCALPLRRIPGALQLNVSPDLIKELVTKDLSAPQVVRLNTTGDNNVDDCMHSGLSLEFDIQYIAK